METENVHDGNSTNGLTFGLLLNTMLWKEKVLGEKPHGKKKKIAGKNTTKIKRHLNVWLITPHKMVNCHYLDFSFCTD